MTPRHWNVSLRSTRPLVVALAFATAALLPAGPVRADSVVQAKAEQTGFSPAGLERIGGFIKNEIATGKIPGGIVLIHRRGQPAYFETFGVRDLATKAPMTPDTIFRIYSMSKPITTVAAMMLVEEAKLALDEPVAKYIPSFKDVKVGVETKGEDGKPVLELVPPRRAMTIQDLMRHTSGTTYGFFGTGLVRKSYVDAKIYGGDFDNAEFAARIAKLPLTFHPGSTWDYSVATDILGRVVEIVAGKPLLEVLKERLFDPLGMTNTSFYVTDAAKHALIAEPMPNDGNIGVDADFFDPRIQRKWESGGGGLVSTISDYARFTQMVINGGTLDGKRYLSPKTLAFMGSNHVGPAAGVVPGPYYLPGPGFGFGLGFSVRTEAGASPLPGSVGELNWGGAGGTYFWIDPKEEMYVIYMVQTPSQRGRHRTALKNLVYGAMEK